MEQLAMDVDSDNMETVEEFVDTSEEEPPRFHARDTIMLLEMIIHPDLQRLAMQNCSVNPLQLADWDYIANWFLNQPSLKTHESDQLYTPINCKNRAFEILTLFAMRNHLIAMPNEYPIFHSLVNNAINQLKTEYLSELDKVEHNLDTAIHQSEAMIEAILGGKYDPPQCIFIQTKIQQMEARKESRTARTVSPKPVSKTQTRTQSRTQSRAQSQSLSPPLRIPVAPASAPPLINGRQRRQNMNPTPIHTQTPLPPRAATATAAGRKPPHFTHNEFNSRAAAVAPAMLNTNKQSLMDTVVREFYLLYVNLTDYKEEMRKQSHKMLEQRWNAMKQSFQNEFEKQLNQTPVESHYLLQIQFEKNMKACDNQKSSEWDQICDEIHQKILKSHETTKNECKRKYAHIAAVDINRAMEIAKERFTLWHLRKQTRSNSPFIPTIHTPSTNTTVSSATNQSQIPFTADDYSCFSDNFDLTVTPPHPMMRAQSAASSISPQTPSALFDQSHFQSVFTSPMPMDSTMDIDHCL